MPNLKRFQKILAKNYPQFSATLKDDCVVLTGEADKYEDLVHAGKPQTLLIYVQRLEDRPRSLPRNDAMRMWPLKCVSLKRSRRNIHHEFPDIRSGTN